jgi:hypothetical protein
MKLLSLTIIAVCLLSSVFSQIEVVESPNGPQSDQVGQPLRAGDYVGIVIGATCFLSFILCGKDIIAGDWDKALMFSKLK